MPGSGDFCIPAAFEAFLVPDSVRALAYESINPEAKSGLKQTIARVCAVVETLSQKKVSTRFFDGFALHEAQCAAPYVVCLCPEDYPYPQCFLAALLPAVLAGVKNILPCFTGKSLTAHTAHSLPCPTASLPPRVEEGQPFPTLLAALDLVGIEQAYTLSVEECLPLFTSLRAEGAGRLILLGQPPDWEQILSQAALLQIPALPFVAPPVVYPWAGQASQHTCTGPALDATHSQVWLWPGLNPSWFQNCSPALYSVV